MLSPHHVCSTYATFSSCFGLTHKHSTKILADHHNRQKKKNSKPNAFIRQVDAMPMRA